MKGSTKFAELLSSISLSPALILLTASLANLSACTIGSGPGLSLNQPPSSASGETGRAPAESASDAEALLGAPTLGRAPSSGVIYADSIDLTFAEASLHAATYDVCVAQNADCSSCAVQALTPTLTQTGLPPGPQSFSALYIRKSDGARTACASFSATLFPLVVEPRYSAASNWNDYVKSATPTVACAGTEDLATDCIHGGEARKVATLESSCDGLSMTDSEDAFLWTCEIVDGTAQFYSTLYSSKRLADFITASGEGWKTMQVTLTGLANPARSTLTTWWSNPILPLPDNSLSASSHVAINLSAAGTLYTLASSRGTAGYYLGADKIAVVTLRGATLSYDGLADNYHFGSHTFLSTSCPSAPCYQYIVYSSDRKFLWIEGDLDQEGSQADYAVGLVRSNSHSRLRSITISGAAGGQNPRIQIGEAKGIRAYSIVLNGDNADFSVNSNSVTGGIFSDLTSSSASFMGSNHIISGVQAKALSLSYASNNSIENLTLSKSMTLQNFSNNNYFRKINISGTSPTPYSLEISSGSTGNRFTESTFLRGSSAAVRIQSGCSNTKFSKVIIANSGGVGLSIVGYPSTPVLNTILSESLIASNNVGIESSNSSGLTVTASTVALNLGSAYYSDADQGTVFHAVAFAGNDSDLMNINDSSHLTFSQLYNSNSSDYSFVLNGTSDDIKIAGVIGGPNLTCYHDGASNPGFTSAPGSACASASSAFEAKTGTANFQGRLLSADSSNTSDDDSLVLVASSITDWFQFENPYRAWGASPTGDRAGIEFGSCTPYSCAIWDWRLNSSDTFLLGKSNDLTTANELLSADSDCPSAALANLTLTTEGDGSTYLKLAIEVLHDSVGDDDGLCEANESCIYTPSIGMDQGAPSWSSPELETCSMGGSPALAGITLQAYRR